MSETKSDRSSVDSIVQFAKGLTGKSLSEVVNLPGEIENQKNRGNLGLLIENYYFEISPGSSQAPDFPEAGLELKTTGVLKSSDGTYKAKERLVLKMINYETIVGETWESSELLKKCRLMLILFYLYEKELAVADRRFVLEPLLYGIANEDLPIIRKDWEFIRDKVLNGKAHELSEGDTFYLGACRKGAGGIGEALRTQPHSAVNANSRAFSFKPKYVNKMIAGQVSESGEIGLTANLTFEEATRQKFQPFIGKSIHEISEELNYFKKGPNHKGFLREIAVRILTNGKSSVSELEKADIEMKTIRLKKNGLPRESMSFPGFKFLDILNENWEESNFCDKIERKFLLIVFRIDADEIERLDMVGYWNMPYLDRLEAQRVWEDTKRRVAIDARNLPKVSESPIAHVRPKARDSRDTLPTPQGGEHVKQSFWLNSGYIAEVLKSL
jgi:DNA mismatch repair protein MutH